MEIHLKHFYLEYWGWQGHLDCPVLGLLWTECINFFLGLTHKMSFKAYVWSSIKYFLFPMSELYEDRMAFLRVKSAPLPLTVQAEVTCLFGRLVVEGSYGTKKVKTRSTLRPFANPEIVLFQLAKIWRDFVKLDD